MPVIGQGYNLSLDYRGTWAAGTSYRVNDVVRYNGSSYVATAASTGQTPSSSSSFWGVLAEQGSPGSAGAAGATGPAGAMGTAGAAGSAGAAASVAVGTTTTGAPGSNASVTNSGSSSAAVLNFTVPQGATGAAGAAGATGPAGPAGASGAALSTTSRTAAYTAAVGDLVLADATSAAFTVTLPASPATNAVVGVKKIDVTSNAVTVAPSGAATIDGDPTALLRSGNQAVEYIYDGAVWRSYTSRISAPGLPSPLTVVGNVYDNRIHYAAGTTGSLTASTQYFMPVWLGKAMPISNVYLYVNSTGGNSQGVASLYSMGQNGLPSALNATGSSSAAMSSTGYASMPLVATIPAGWSFVSFQLNTPTTASTFQVAAIGSTFAPTGVAAAMSSIFPVFFYTISSATFPTPTTTAQLTNATFNAATNSTAPIVFWKARL